MATHLVQRFSARNRPSSPGELDRCGGLGGGGACERKATRRSEIISAGAASQSVSAALASGVKLAGVVWCPRPSPSWEATGATPVPKVLFSLMRSWRDGQRIYLHSCRAVLVEMPSSPSAVCGLRSRGCSWLSHRGCGLSSTEDSLTARL